MLHGLTMIIQIALIMTLGHTEIAEKLKMSLLLRVVVNLVITESYKEQGKITIFITSSSLMSATG